MLKLGDYSDLLGWEPVITMDEQLAKMAKDLLLERLSKKLGLS
jgi:hypothetical protein